MSFESDIQRVREILQKQPHVVDPQHAINAWESYRQRESAKYHRTTFLHASLDETLETIADFEKITEHKAQFRIRAIRPLCVDPAYTTLFIGDFSHKRPIYHVALLQGYEIIPEQKPKDNQSLIMYQPRNLCIRSRSRDQ